MKYEDVYLHDYGDGLGIYFAQYNKHRPHMALDHGTPAEWYWSAGDYGGQPAIWEALRAAPKTRRAERTVAVLARRLGTTLDDF